MNLKLNLTLPLMQRTSFKKAWEDFDSNVFLSDWSVPFIFGLFIVGEVFLRLRVIKCKEASLHHLLSAGALLNSCWCISASL